MVSMNNIGYASSQRTEIILKDDVDRCWNLCLPLVLLLYYIYTVATNDVLQAAFAYFCARACTFALVAHFLSSSYHHVRKSE